MSTHASTSVDLLGDPSLWAPWSPRSEIAPLFAQEASGPGGGPSLVVAATGSPLACGCWRRGLPRVVPGRRYRIEAAFLTDGVDRPAQHVWPMVTHCTGRQERAYELLDHCGERDGWLRMASEIEPDEDVQGLALCLYFAWSTLGRVRFADVRMADVTDEAKPDRRVRLAAVSGNPERPQSSADSAAFYCERIDDVGPRGVDLVCLPELINCAGVPGRTQDLAEPIPGPTSERLASKAREYGTYVAASLAERDGAAVYNTGLLLDRAGEVVGKYHKTHLPMGEGFPDGTAPGQDYPVFDADFGRIGYMICWDTHFPEVARMLAIQGAEVIVNSNMGDGREGRTLWEPVIRTRAIDNQVHIAAAVNSGQSCIVSPRGELLAMTDRSRGAIAYAAADLSITVRNYTGRQIRRRYDHMRRADTYGLLTREILELRPGL